MSWMSPTSQGASQQQRSRESVFRGNDRNSRSGDGARDRLLSRNNRRQYQNGTPSPVDSCWMHVASASRYEDELSRRRGEGGGSNKFRNGDGDDYYYYDDDGDPSGADDEEDDKKNNGKGDDGIVEWYRKRSKTTKLVLWASSVGILTLAIFFSVRYVMRKSSEKEDEDAVNENRSERFKSVLKHMEVEDGVGGVAGVQGDYAAIGKESLIDAHSPLTISVVNDYKPQILQLLTDAGSICTFLTKLQNSPNVYIGPPPSGVEASNDDTSILKSIRLAILKIEMAHYMIDTYHKVNGNISGIAPINSDQLELLRQMESRILLKQRNASSTHSTTATATPSSTYYSPTTDFPHQKGASSVWEQLDR